MYNDKLACMYTCRFVIITLCIYTLYMQVEYAMRHLYVLVNLCELQSMDLNM